MYNITCPHCRQTLSVPPEWSNRVVRCSYCNQSLQVPTLGAASGPAPATTPGPPPAGPARPPVVAPNAAAPPPYMNPMSGAPPAPGGPPAGPGPVVDTGDSHSGGSSIMQQRSRRRSSKGLLAWYSGGGGVVLLLIILCLKLLPILLEGASGAAYEQDCENVRWEAYERYAAYGSRDYVKGIVDEFHEDCVADATETGYRSSAKLNRRAYFDGMDYVFDELRRQNMMGS